MTPTVAIVTMVHNEGQMLRLWVDHYARQVGLKHLVVLDDNSTDGSTDGLGCTVHRLPPLDGSRFEGTRMRLVSGIAAGLLAAYDYVAFVDGDEFLIADPARHASLPDFLASRAGRDIIGVTALNVMHVPDLEAPLDLGRPILEQRSFAKFAPLMCKPAIKRVPAPWAAASHGIRGEYAVDGELFMLHLKFADRDHLTRVAALRNAQTKADGRALRSSWRLSSDDVVGVFDKTIRRAKPEKAPEFDPRRAGLDKLIHRENDIHRTPKVGQLRVLKEQELVRIPARLKGAL